MKHPKEIEAIQSLILVKGGTILTDDEKKSLDSMLDVIYLDGRIDKLKEMQKEIKEGV